MPRGGFDGRTDAWCRGAMNSVSRRRHLSSVFLNGPLKAPSSPGGASTDERPSIDSHLAASDETDRGHRPHPSAPALAPPELKTQRATRAREAQSSSRHGAVRQFAVEAASPHDLTRAPSARRTPCLPTLFSLCDINWPAGRHVPAGQAPTGKQSAVDRRVFALIAAVWPWTPPARRRMLVATRSWAR
jgi:hypothetical protein